MVLICGRSNMWVSWLVMVMESCLTLEAYLGHMFKNHGTPPAEVQIVGHWKNSWPRAFSFEFHRETFSMLRVVGFGSSECC